MTPPTPPPSTDEKEKFDGKDAFVSNNIVVTAVKTYKVIYWGNLLCQTAVVLAANFPSAASEDVLSFLTWSSTQARNVQSTPVWLAGCALMALGGGIRLLCYRTLGKFFTWQLAVKKDHALITHGPYAVVRHPSYTGSVMLGIGTVLAHFGPGGWYHECVGYGSWASRLFVGAWGGWSLALIGILLARVPAEDAILRNEFGEEWDAWARRTPYRLIPYVY
ncbi:hypothetical protein PHLGIDRAFT_32420 [Phlebiopsis gigantea 11061_1 CR5-6]|uniref:Protein-S-isoprenylcysteine O-methyltransferase n=1 Tax=Phlebiopsis gigantea (strain 11061_1 CR5-6) TaxID=745531 RepID=A0A0C3S2G7_PHLG1|nr:hypothetical protein PHLGIDRAFT_32420 [Phlebiopsis gigantea 11061_1 CR5-6]